jgi:hypothetical protein
LAPSRIASAAVALLLAAGLAACGSSSGSSSTSTTQQAGARRGFFSDPKVQACLKKEGVQVPDFRRGNGQPPSGSNGQPPSGTNGQPPSGSNGQRPNGGGFRNSAEAQKIRQALQKCGVTLPSRGQNGPPQQQTTTGDTTNS